MNNNNTNDLEILYGIQPTGPQVTTKKKIFSELINLTLIMITFLILFMTIGKKVIIPKYSQDAINSINEIYQRIADEEGYEVITIKSNYGFIEISEDKFIEQYLKENPDSNDTEAFEKYIDTRFEMIENVRKDPNFKIYNGRFSSVYFITFILLIFVITFVFEFMIPVLNKKTATIGMLITKLSITNVNDNDYPNKLKLLPRYMVILLIEHILLRYFFGNVYFIVSFLINIIIIFATPNKMVLHDIASMTKVIRTNYVGYIES